MYDFYTTKEVAEMYGLKEGTIRQFINRKQLEATKVGTIYIITPKQLKAWEKNRKPKKRSTK